MIPNPRPVNTGSSESNQSRHVGKLDKGLDEAPKRGWTIVSMMDDWNRIDPGKECLCSEPGAQAAIS